MKKIIIIQERLPQYRKEFFNLLKGELIKHNIHLVLIYGKAKSSEALKEDEVDLEWAIKISNRHIRLGKNEFIWQPCLKTLSNSDMIIVEQANKLILNYFLIFFRKLIKPKICFWGHGTNLKENSSHWKNKFKFLFLKKCDWWFAYTASVKTFLIEKNYPGNRITVVQNAIDTYQIRKYYSEINNNELEELKGQFGIISGNVGIFCGAMYKEKRLDFILQTCYRIKREIPDFQMIFIGSGIDSYIVSEASRIYNWIHYVGPKFGYNRVKYFKISSIQLMPGLVGLAILDSFALETPIITTNHYYHSPEIEYLKNEKNGIITKNNVDDYSKVIIDLLLNRNYMDMIGYCKESAKKYNLETMVDNFKTGILECLKTKRQT
jgi:glycosyltransferase involved in cell wall biosynthesis